MFFLWFLNVKIKIRLIDFVFFPCIVRAGMICWTRFNVFVFILGFKNMYAYPGFRGFRACIFVLSFSNVKIKIGLIEFVFFSVYRTCWNDLLNPFQCFCFLSLVSKICMHTRDFENFVIYSKLTVFRLFSSRRLQFITLRRRFICSAVMGWRYDEMDKSSFLVMS